MSAFRGKYPQRVAKFRNIKCQVDGIDFDSKKEARRYGELLLIKSAGVITELKLQPRYPLYCGLEPIKIRNKHGQPRQTFYLADFEYEIAASGELVVEDVKGFDTPVSRLKRAIMEAHYQIRVKII